MKPAFLCQGFPTSSNIFHHDLSDILAPLNNQVGDVNSSMARRIAATLSPSGEWAPLGPVAGLFKPRSGKPLVVSPGRWMAVLEVFC